MCGDGLLQQDDGLERLLEAAHLVKVDFCEPPQRVAAVGKAFAHRTAVVRDETQTLDPAVGVGADAIREGGCEQTVDRSRAAGAAGTDGDDRPDHEAVTVRMTGRRSASSVRAASTTRSDVIASM